MNRDVNIERELDEQSLVALGYVGGISLISKAGRNPAINTGAVPVDVWNTGGVYTGFPTTGVAEQLGVASTSVNDTAAGSGARSIRIIGLDANYAVSTEDVVLSGTTEVFTTKTFWRVHTAFVLTSGGAPTNSAFNAGTIVVRHRTTTANVFLGIIPGTNQSNSAGYTVPAGSVALVKRITGSVRGNQTSTTADFILWIREFGQAPRLRRPATMFFGGQTRTDIWGGIVLGAKADIHVRVTSVSSNGTDVTAGYELLLANGG